jgi:hypothetical protein
MDNAVDESRCVFIALQWQFIILFLFKVPEHAQIKGLKYVSCVRRESDDFHSVICDCLQCLRLYMNGTTVHEQNSFFICEFFIRPEFVDVKKENR